MTRINVVPPSELTDKHLVAEYYELPRVFTLVKKAVERGEKPEFYKEKFKEYTLGTGHAKFFYGRLRYLCERFIELVVEMQTRKMRPNSDRFDEYLKGIPKEWFGNYKPTEKAMAENRARIAERLEEAKEKKKRKALTPHNMHLMDENGEVR